MNGCLQILTHSINPKLSFFFLACLLNHLKFCDPSFLMPSNVAITPAQSACNFSVLLDSTFGMSDHICSISESYFLSLRNFRRIRNTLDLPTARTIATSLIHCKIDHWNSLFLNLVRSQLGRLQLILNFSARAVSKTPQFAHISLVLKSLQRLKIELCINIKLLLLQVLVLHSSSIRTAYLSPQPSQCSILPFNWFLWYHHSRDAPVSKLLTCLLLTMLL